MKVLKFQHWHFLMLSVLLIGIYFYVLCNPTFLKGELLGFNTATWFLFAILSFIVHQIYVLVCWRMELFYNNLSNVFGAKGFKIYKIGFAILILSRVLTIIVLVASSAHTLENNAVFAYILAGIIFFPPFYFFYSVRKYFGFDSAFGIDHFNSKAFENKPFVRKGIFKYTAIGMYIYGFPELWIPGLLLLSKAALVAALFNHVYIWVHCYFTELPDIKIIYKY